MKTLYVILCSILFAWSVQAQVSISGKIVHKETDAPIAHANIVFSNSSGYFNGVSSDENGKFSILVPSGCYTIEASHVGFKSTKKDSICALQSSTQIKDIKLSPKADLKGVEIIGQAESPDDRFVFKPKDIITGDGGSALEIFRNIPLIQVESNGKIKLRGSRGVQIWIDGRQSGLTGAAREAFLANLPANAIESIEIITNPGASFDADGSSGIINIITKKSALNGLRASIGINAGTGHKYGAFGRLDYANKKVIIGADYSYRYTQSLRKYYSERHNILPFENDFYRLNGGRNFMGTHFAKISLNYKPKPKWTLYSDLIIQYAYATKDRFLNQQQFFSTNQLWLSNQTRNAIEGESGLTAEAFLGVEKTFDTKKHKLKLEAAYTYRPDTADRHFTRQFFNETYHALIAPNEFYQLFEKRRIHMITARADYQIPLPKNFELEMGLKSIYRNNNNLYNRYDLDASNNQMYFNGLVSNHFIYKEQIHAGYLELSHTLKKWKFKLGIRPEFSHIQVDQLSTQNSVRNSYWNFYPSSSVSFKPKKNHQLRLSYSKRVNRPSAGELNPFPDYSDPLSISYGNPYLKPEYTHSGELMYTLDKSKFFFSSAAYYKYTTHVIGRFAALDTVTGITQVSYQNLKNSHNTGLEFSARAMVSRFTFQSSLNLYYFKINGSNLESDLSQNNIGAMLKFLSSVKVWKNMFIQASATVLSPQIGPQKTTFWRYYFDAGIRKEFLKNRLAVSLSVSDFANTDRTITQTRGLNFTEYRNRKRESLIGMLTIIWKFGKIENNNPFSPIDVQNNNENEND